MKKLIFATILMLISFVLSAQTENLSIDNLPKSSPLPKAKTFNRWSIGAAGLLTYANTDIASSDFNGDYVKRNPGIQVDVTRFLSHSVALQLRYLYGNISGENKDLSYETTINSETTLSIIGSIGNISFLDRKNNLNLYASLGLGIINTTADMRYKHSTKKPIDYGSPNEQIAVFGLGLKYKVTTHAAITLEGTYHHSNSDKLDGYVNVLTNYDDYTTLGLGLAYTLGKKKEALEWRNPILPIAENKPILIMQDTNSLNNTKALGDAVDAIVTYFNGQIDSLKNIPVHTDTLIVNELSTVNNNYISNLQSIYFDFNSDKINPQFKYQLATIALTMVRDPGLNVDLTGTADTVGNDEYNNKLSQKRIHAVSDFLQRIYHIDKSRIQENAVGKKDPATTINELNRRVDFKLYKK